MNIFRSILFAITAFSLLIFRFGYIFGRYDQSEILPYCLYLGDKSFYPHDFFIQGINSFIPNERIIISTMLSFFRDILQPSVFILHLITTLILIVGMEKLFMLFIRNRFVVWGAILFCTVIVYIELPGANDVYSPYFLASNLASALGVWAIYYFIKRKYIGMSILLIFSTFIQPLIGLQLCMILTTILFIDYFQHKKILLKDILLPTLLYGCTAFIFILLIKVKYDQNLGTLSNKEYFEIMFLFRHPHHYIPSQFPISGYFLLLVFSFFSILFFRKKNFQIFLFILISLSGCLIYTLAVELFESVFVANFQWFEIIVWIKIFGFIALASYTDKMFLSSFSFRPKTEYFGLTLLILILWIIILGYREFLPWKCPYDFGQQVQKDPIVEICLQIAQKTPKDAVFIQPFEVTELKYYSKRSSYVEFKTIVRQKGMAEIWFKRMEEVYGVSLGTKKNGFKMKEDANLFFFSLTSEDLRKLRNNGVTHVLTYSEHSVDKAKLVFENSKYKVFELF